MTYKPVDTAIIMTVGPCVDDTDFKSLEEAIAYNAAGMDISLIVEKTDGTSVVTAITLTTGGTSDWTHKDGGYYEVEITAAQNAEEGVAYLRGVCTGVLPFESIGRYDVVPANIYDSLVKGTDKLEIDLIQMGGVAQSATDLKDFADEGYNPAYHALSPSAIRKIWEDLVSGQTTSGSLGLLLRNNLNASVSSRNSVEPDPAGTLATYDPPTNTEMVAAFTEIKGSTFVTGTDSLEALRNRGDDAWITAVGFSTHSAANVWSVGTRALTDKSNFGLSTASINLIWDDLLTGITQVGSIGKLIADNLNATITSRSVPNEYDTQMGYIPSNLGDVPIASELNTTHGSGSWATATGFGTLNEYDVRMVALQTDLDNPAQYKADVSNLDVAVSTRSSHTAANVWSSVTRSLTDKAGFSLSSIGIKAIWDQLTSGLTTIGSLGKLLVDNINATISSRSPASEYDTEMARLDVAVSTRNAIAPNVVIPDVAGTAATLHGVTDGKIDVMDAIVDAIKAKTDNLPSGITKGEALPKFDFLIVLSSDHVTAATGKIITGEIMKDGGNFVSITNAITEVSNGMYTIADGFTATEMNADMITLKFDGIGCDTRIIGIVTT